jgi:hypothetical protein
MFLLILAASSYFLTLLLLFKTQSLVHFGCVVLALWLLRQNMSGLNLKGLKMEHIEWVSLIRFFLFIKIWHILSIRLMDIRLLKLIKFVKFILSYIKKWIKASNKIWQLHYIDNIKKCSIMTLERLEARVKYLYYLLNKKEKTRVLSFVTMKKDNRRLVSYDYNK